MKLLGALALLAVAVQGQIQPIGVPFKSPVTVASGYSAHVLFSNLTSPRGITIDGGQNLLVVERGVGISVFSPRNISTGGTPAWERALIIKNPNLTQGIQVDGNRLYVSTANQVLLYTWDPTTKTAGANGPLAIIDGLPADGAPLTHALLLEESTASNVLLVGSGPLTNIDSTARDPKSGRSQIRRFAWPRLTDPPVSAPISWDQGQVVAYGIHNPAGFAFPTGPSVTPVGTHDLFVVDNSPSIENVPGFTPAFANDNPADELELVNYPTATSAAPRFYGSPDCATLWNGAADPVSVPQYVGAPRGTQIGLNLDTARDDVWCRNATNNRPPVLSFQAHSVPLDIQFYVPPVVSTTDSLPTDLANHAFVSVHGSTDRAPPIGYGVVHVPFPTVDPPSDALQYSYVVQATDLRSCPGACIRPVGLVFGRDGRLFVTSDSSGELFVIQRAALTP